MSRRINLMIKGIFGVAGGVSMVVGSIFCWYALQADPVLMVCMAIAGMCTFSNGVDNLSEE